MLLQPLERHKEERYMIFYADIVPIDGTCAGH
jgi:hypothetical protein